MRQLTLNQMPAAEDEQTLGAQFYSISGVLGIWFLFTGVQWALWLINQAVSPNTVERLNQVWFVVAGVIAVALIVKQRPTIFSASVLRPRWPDLPLALIVGYVDVNIRFLLLEPPFTLGFDAPLKMILVIVFLPIIEELICRGAIVRSLIQRMHIVWAILLSSALFSLAHIAFWPAFAAQVFLSLIYIVRNRSLAASLMYHVITNCLVFFPHILVTAHWRHIV